MEETSVTKIKNPKVIINQDSTADVEDKSKDNASKDASNLNAGEIDSETMAKLRGDAIGNTLYSESFVAKTLLQLSDIQWSEKLEEDLCFLWDMTLEKDACLYLLKLSFPNIACAVINKYDENRLLEIVIGILANICCITDTSDISNEQLEIITSVIRSDDPLILIQVVRFIKALAYDREILHFINEGVLEHIQFILKNSCNIELLLNTLDAVSKMTADYKLEVTFLKGELLKSSVIAYQCICNIERERLCLDEIQIESNHQRTSLTHLIQIASNICCYINVETTDRLLTETNLYANEFIQELSKIFNCYSKDESLLPVSEELQFYIDAVIFIFQVLNITYQREMFINVTSITNILLKNKCEEVDLFLELVCYFISIGKLQDLKADLGCFKKGDIFDVLNKIKSTRPICDFTYKENLDTLLIEFKT